MSTWFDYAFEHPDPSALVAAGAVGVCRYLAYDTPATHAKLLLPAERDALLAAGLDVALNWEYDAQDALRGAQGGTQDATEAVAQARALGYRPGATIYHSIDFGATAGQMNTVGEYVRACRAVESSAGYRTGAYGDAFVIAWLYAQGLIDDAWQTAAWSNGQWDSRAAMRQVQNGVTVGGVDADRDEQVGTVHAWKLTGEATMTPAQLDMLMTTFGIVDGMRAGADTYWRYTNGVATSADLTPFWQKLAKVVGTPPPAAGTPVAYQFPATTLTPVTS